MSDMRFRLPMLLLPLLFVAACGGGDDDASSGGAPADADAFTVDPAEAATIAGTVRFEGAAPPPEAIDMSDEPTCAAKHDQPPARHRVAVSNGMLGNVFVYVKEGLGDRRFATPSNALVVDQDGCVYAPHVSGVQTGQQITFRNSDGLLHNINARASTNRSFNISQPQNMESQRTFNQQEVMVPIRCDVHGWMEAYIGVLPHPYFAVTGADGSFRLENLPPGNYTVEAWHEVYGVQTMQVTVAAQQTGEASFTFSEGMAGAVVPLGAPIDPHDHHGAPAAPGTPAAQR